MKIKDGIIYREEDGLVFDTKNGKLIELNETGNQIFLVKMLMLTKCVIF